MTDNTELLRKLDCHWCGNDKEAAKAIRALEGQAKELKASFDRCKATGRRQGLKVERLEAQVKEYKKVARLQYSKDLANMQ